MIHTQRHWRATHSTNRSIYRCSHIITNIFVVLYIHDIHFIFDENKNVSGTDDGGRRTYTHICGHAAAFIGHRDMATIILSAINIPRVYAYIYVCIKIYIYIYETVEIYTCVMCMYV